MRVFVAGAAGTLGRLVVRQLVQAGHEVVGSTSRRERAELIEKLGAEVAVVDALDAGAVREAIGRARPEVVIELLSSLPRRLPPTEMRFAAELSRRVRLEGGANIQSAAEACGARRYIVASAALCLAPGSGLADEATPFDFAAPPALVAEVRLCAEIERRALNSPRIEGIALRYGLFYGPGTWYWSDGEFAEQVRAQRTPLIGDGGGVWPWVHIEDAAAATVAAIALGDPGPYLVTDDDPARLRVWLPAFARWVDAPPPPRIPASEDLEPGLVYFATRLRGASNAKARRALGFDPRPQLWLQPWRFGCPERPAEV